MSGPLNEARIPNTEIISTWEYITPELAQKYLEKNVDNRVVRNKHFAKMVRDMEQGHYLVTHQGIAFDKEGYLSDGQHRLMGVVRSGKSVWMLVTRGLDSNVKNIIDLMARRLATDFMTGSKHRVNRGSAIKVLIALDEMNFTFSANQLRHRQQMVTNYQIQEAWERWPDIEELTGMAKLAARNVPTAGPSPLLASSLVYPETSKDFLAGLSTMEGLEAQDPRLALIRYRGTPGSQKQYHQSNQVSLCVKAAKAFAEGRKLPQLRVNPAEVIRCFPLLPVGEAVVAEVAETDE